jgi:hypothetical protein
MPQIGGFGRKKWVIPCTSTGSPKAASADYNKPVQTTSLNFSRRTLLSTLAAGAAASAQNREPREWKPRLGVLGPYTEANLAFAREAGFNNMILGATPRTALDAAALDDGQIAKIKAVMPPSAAVRTGIL